MLRTCLLFVGAALVMSLAVGCGKTETAGPAIKPADLSREEVAEFLAGHWAGAMQLDEQAATKALEKKEVAYVRSMKMDMIFHKDGKLDQTGEDNGKQHKDQGTWEYVSAEEMSKSLRKITIKAKGSGGVEKKIDLILDGENAFEIPLTMKTAQVGSMRFERR
jgi:hypothetical protein